MGNEVQNMGMMGKTMQNTEGIQGPLKGLWKILYSKDSRQTTAALTFRAKWIEKADPL